MVRVVVRVVGLVVGLTTAGATARVATVVLAGLLASCSQPSSVSVPPAAPAPGNAQAVAPTDAAARIAGFVAGHNARVARLETVESRGSLELRYRDADGEHFDQCEFDVFLAAGGRGALRATKLGNNFLWIGGDGVRGWVFRLDTEPTLLKVYDHVSEHDLGQGADGAGEFALLTPGTVRALAGLQPIAEQNSVRPVDGADPALPAEARSEVVYQSGGATVCVRFGATDGLPASVRVLDARGDVLVSSTLGEYVPAQAANLAQGAWPRLPRRVEIVAARADGRATLHLDEPIAMAKRMKPRFFSLEELTAQFRPDRVEHAVAAEDGAIEPASGGGK